MSSPAASHDLRLTPPAGARWDLVGDQMVVAARSARRPIVLDPVASAVWPSLATGVSPREASEWLVDEVGIDRASTHASVLALVEQLMTARFLIAESETQAEPERMFRATVTPCDAAPYLKGPTDTVEIEIGGHAVTFVVLQRVGGATLFAGHRVRPSSTEGADEVFLIGRPPKRGGAVLVDHLGSELLSTDVGGVPASTRMLCDDLASQSSFDVGLRGVAVPYGRGIVILDERLRPAVNAEVVDGRGDLRPAPLPVLGVRSGPNGLTVTMRDHEPPHAHRTAPIVELISMDPVTGPASAVAVCAAFLADQTDLVTAQWLVEQVPVRTAPSADPLEAVRPADAGR